MLVRLLSLSTLIILLPSISAAQPDAVFQPVRLGIDVLEAQRFQSLAGQRVGLITNHTGRSVDGRSTAEILQATPEVNLTALFSPEHGLEGKLDVAKIGDSRDVKTGLDVFSLYGATRRPTPEMLAGIDTLVFDIQDVGTRFYTYISTMGEAMQAADEEGKRFVVLDRPNPIGGIVVTGPMLDAEKESFVGFHHLPVRHGMTIGEIAKMMKVEKDLELELEIVRCDGWQRTAAWDQTNLTWINPSPNLRNLTQAYLYPGVGLLETTNVSVGRGTDTPFETLGAPWIDGRVLARRLNARAIPGVRFIPVEFTPDASVYKDQPCTGVNIMLTNRDELQSVRVGLEIAASLHALYPQKWQTHNLNRLLGNDLVLQSIRSGEDIDTTLQKASQGVSDFLVSRRQYMIYE